MTEHRPTDEGFAGTRRTAATSRTRQPHLERCVDRHGDPVEFGRIVALTDAVFAIALTLLVLDLALPAATADAPLATALAELSPQFLAFAISVAVVGTFFHSNFELLSMLQKFDGALLGLTIPYLGFVVLIPFAQGVLGARPGESLAYAVYATVLGCAAAVESGMLWHAHRKGLLRHPLRGRVAHFEALRAALPVAVFFSSAGLAFVIGSRTILLWLALWPLDSLLTRLERRSSP